MSDSFDNLETRIERMPFDELKSKCDSVVEDWKSKSALAPALVDRESDRYHADRRNPARSRSEQDEGAGVGDVVTAFEARIDHLEKKLLGLQNEHRKQLRHIKRSYLSGIAVAIVITLVLIGASVALQIF